MKREKAVTREDLGDLQDSLVTRIRAEMEARLEERLKTKLDTTVFEARMDKVERDIRVLMLDSVDKGARMDAMEARLNARMDALSRTVADKLDGAVGRMETRWRETVTFPRVLDAHGAQLAGHEARIASLEARRAL